MRSLGSVVLSFLLIVAVLCIFGISRHDTDAKRVGALRLQFKLPKDPQLRRESIVSKGDPGLGVAIFVAATDRNHLQVGADAWGGLLLSEPIAIDPLATQELIADFSILHADDPPAGGSISQGEKKHDATYVRLELNGRPLVKEERSSPIGAKMPLLIGRASHGGSAAPAAFEGSISRVERLRAYSTVAIVESNSLSVRADFSDLPFSRRQPLFSFRDAGGIAAAFVERVRDTAVRVGFIASSGAEIISPEIRTSSLMDLNFIFGSASTSSPLTAQIFRKGELLAGNDTRTEPIKPFVAYVGQNETGSHGVDARYVGSNLEVNTDINLGQNARGPTSGAYDIFLTLPTYAPTAEPILVCGRPGAGDFVYIKYLDASHIALGADHWGSAGTLSEPIAIDYELPHRFTVNMDCLDVDNAHNPSNPKPTTVDIDGTRALTFPTASYPCSRSEIYLAANPLGGSSCGTQFTGKIHAIHRRIEQ